MTEETADTASQEDVLRMAVDIVAAYVSSNKIQSEQISHAINSVFGSLNALNNGAGGASSEGQKPAVSLRRSITPDFIICLEDGKKMKMLKRHLRTTFGMTPEDYRAKWDLPSDYPMVAPNYAKKRSEFAKKIGLGRTSGKKKKAPGRKE